MQSNAGAVQSYVYDCDVLIFVGDHVQYEIFNEFSVRNLSVDTICIISILLLVLKMLLLRIEVGFTS